jgi:hypothetical protein
MDKRGSVLLYVGIAVLVLIIGFIAVGGFSGTGGATGGAISTAGAKENQTQSCIDSDGGVNYNVSGHVNITFYSNGSRYRYNDNCYSSTGLSEYYCGGSYAAVMGYICPNGCNNGACIVQNQTHNTCTDSDGGLNYYNNGTASDNSGHTGTDFCGNGPNNLSEYYCDSGHVSQLYYLCPQGYACSYGECVIGNQTQNNACVDTDSGINHYVKGTTTNNTLSRQDECFIKYYTNGSVQNKFECSNTINYSCGNQEYFCTDSWINSVATTCPNGCLNGACVVQNQTNQTCTDSDGGLNYYTPGNTSGYYGNSYYLYNDSCNAVNHILNEQFCLDNQAAASSFDCFSLGSGYSCSDGACISNQTNQTCIDTDGGINYFVNGTLTNSTGNYLDFCYGNILYERYCTTSGGSAISSFNCTNLGNYKCQNGACVLNQTCNAGWKCKEGSTRGYQLSNCSWTSLSNCPYGCLNGACKPKPCTWYSKWYKWLIPCVAQAEQADMGINAQVVASDSGTKSCGFFRWIFKRSSCPVAAEKTHIDDSKLR